MGLLYGSEGKDSACRLVSIKNISPAAAGNTPSVPSDAAILHQDRDSDYEEAIHGLGEERSNETYDEGIQTPAALSLFFVFFLFFFITKMRGWWWSKHTLHCGIATDSRNVL